MKILKVFCVIFILHLIPVAWVFYAAGRNSEAVMGWLYCFVEPVIRHPFNDFWNGQLTPALFFQIVGSINGLLIYLIFRRIFRAVRKFS